MLKQGKVVAIHPESNAVDLIMNRTGERLSNIQVLAPNASTRTGRSGLATPTPASGSDPYSIIETNNLDIWAAVAMMDGYPVVVGFRFPDICQMLFLAGGRRIDRHESDLYTSIDAEGNFELYHPSGTYFRIGASNAHEDLTGLDFDGNWKITQNTTSTPQVHLTVANGGAVKASVNIDQNGNMTTAAATWTHTGPMTVDGAFAVSGAGITVTGGDVVADNYSLKTHPHSGVQTGSGQSGPPVAA